jgi:hypothetical protein
VDEASVKAVLSLAPDTRERHALVGRLVGGPARVLDVGGLPGQLQPHLARGSRVVTVNVEPPTDLLMEGTSIPVEDNAFEVVTSVDTLEHIPPADRAPFVAELLRVASRRVVLCCPYGSAEHRRGEEELLEWFSERTGERHRWLGEHVDNGLPGEQELRELFAGELEVRFRYHGDFRASQAEFKHTVTGLQRGVRGRLGLAGRWLAHRRDLGLADQPSEWTNRVFVTVSRA